MPSFDVVIIGGGIVGSSIAYFLVRDPSFEGTVIIIEEDPTFSQSSTSRAVGGIRQQFSVPENIRMSAYGAEFIREAPDLLAIDGIRPVIPFRENGYLLLASENHLDVLRTNHAIQRSCGANTVLMNPAQLQVRFPWLDPRGVALGSLGMTNEGWVDQVRLHRALLAKALSLGAAVRRERVTAISTAGGSVRGVGLSSGESIACGYLVNAAGARAGDIARLATVEPFPVEPRKRIVYAFKGPDLGPRTPLVVDTTGVWFRPRNDTMYLCGVSPPAEQDPACDDLDAAPTLFHTLVRPALETRIPSFRNLCIADAWAGHYAFNTFDQNAILGPHPRLRNLLFANGFSGHGFQQAPSVGRAISEYIIAGEYRALDLSRFSYDRILRKQDLRETNII